MKHLIVFFFMILVDIAWTMYMVEVEKRRHIYAGLWSSLIMIIGSAVTISYIEDKQYLISAALGAFVGTAITVYYKKVKEKNGR